MDEMSGIERAFQRLVELRVQFRGRPVALLVIDRALVQLTTMAQEEARALAEREAEAARIAEEVQFLLARPATLTRN